MGIKFKSAEMEPYESTVSDVREPMYPHFNVEQDLDAEVGEEVTVVLRGKVKSIREEDDSCCYDLEVHEIGIPTDDEDEKAVVDVRNEADRVLSKMKSKDPTLY